MKPAGCTGGVKAKSCAKVVHILFIFLDFIPIIALELEFYLLGSIHLYLLAISYHLILLVFPEQPLFFI